MRSDSSNIHGAFLVLVLLTAIGAFWTEAFADPSVSSDSAKKTGGWRLNREASPYLRMHADNPVEWYAWGEEAFAKAKAGNKPLFISIGYFTCHWCHVMERESFSNPEIAKILHDHFVSIKIAREQRPDLDDAYMRFVQVTTGHGGWPMSVWATPDGDPFLGGTYFPPEARYGRSGMRDLLPRIHQRWIEDQTGLIAVSKRVVAHLQGLEAGGRPLQRFSRDILTEAQRQFRLQFDELHGGFGSAPKFPQPGQLLYLLLDSEADGAQMALHTLDHMAAGGIYDHLAGGFHRYSTDAQWKLPHFEKMLYDQALIVRPYLAAFQKTGKPYYAQVVREVLDFTLQEMHDPRGGFYSALSADSPVSHQHPEEMQEGAFYGWSEAQWKAALEDDSLRAIGTEYYGVEARGNVRSGELAGSNVLYRARTTKELAKKFQLSEQTAQQKIAQVNAKLLEARRQRPPVPVDDKVVTVWNGYMITALVNAGTQLKAPRYTRAAEQTAEFILSELYDRKQGILYRDWRAGDRGVPGFAEDYAAMAEGFLALYDASGDRRWLDLARELTDLQIKQFWDEDRGGFFGSTGDTRLWVRNKDATDGVTPSPNAVAIHNLLQLGRLTKNAEYTRLALRTGAWVGGLLQDIPNAMPYTLIEWPALMVAADAKTTQVVPNAR